MARNNAPKIELTAYDDLFQTDESRAEAKLSKIRDIPISQIDEFPDHPFKVLMDEDMQQLVESIKRNGIMTPANIVFTDLSTVSYLLYGTDGETSVQYGDFYVNDPDELDRIMTEVEEIEGVNWDNCTLTRYDNDYQNAKESLAGLQNIVFIAIAVVSVICFLVLALFLTLRLRGRIHETGVYLAMGISKGAVLMQYLLEVLIVAVAALLISYGASSAISDQIGSRLLSQVTAETYETVELTDEAENTEQPSAEDLGLSEIVVDVSAKDYALVWGFGLVLCLASTALAAYPIMKMKPKNILSQMS